jgi:hypothetical protein
MNAESQERLMPNISAQEFINGIFMQSMDSLMNIPEAETFGLSSPVYSKQINPPLLIEQGFLTRSPLYDIAVLVGDRFDEEALEIIVSRRPRSKAKTSFTYLEAVVRQSRRSDNVIRFAFKDGLIFVDSSPKVRRSLNLGDNQTGKELLSWDGFLKSFEVTAEVLGL